MAESACRGWDGYTAGTSATDRPQRIPDSSPAPVGARVPLTLDDSQLEEHRRIEHRVGILLEGEYPLVLSCTDRRPAADGFLSRDSPVLMVADDTAQQTVVCCRDIIMVVEQDGGQC